MKYTYFTILLTLLALPSFAQYDVLEDDPYLNGFYLGGGLGYNLRSGTSVKFDGRAYLKDALFNVDLQLGFDSKLKQHIGVNMLPNVLDSSILSPEKYKKSVDFELGACYNFERKIFSTTKWIKTYSGVSWDFYHLFNITLIRLIGVRGGIGSFRGRMNANSIDMLSKNKENDFQLDATYYTTIKDDSTKFVYNNFGGSYIYAGIQVVKNFNILREAMLWNVRKAQHITYYADVIIPTNSRISDLRIGNSTKTFEVTARNKDVRSPIGFRLGAKDRILRYAGVVGGLEGGVMPGFKINSDLNYISRKVRDDTTFPATGFYFNISISFNFSGPLNRVDTYEFKN